MLDLTGEVLTSLHKNWPSVLFSMPGCYVRRLFCGCDFLPVSRDLGARSIVRMIYFHSASQYEFFNIKGVMTNSLVKTLFIIL